MPLTISMGGFAKSTGGGVAGVVRGWAGDGPRRNPLGMAGLLGVVVARGMWLRVGGISARRAGALGDRERN